MSERTAERTFVELARRDKLAELRSRGVEPFPYRFERTHTAAEAVAALGPAPEAEDGAGEGPEVAVAGRLVALRAHGKATFAHLADRSGRIQLYFRGDDLGAAAYALLPLLDLGDHLGARGRVFRTRTGEVTVRVAGFELLA